MNDDLFMRAIAWRNGPDTGLSSIALLCYLMGWPNPGKREGDDRRYPDDSDAFGRCVGLLKSFPEFRERLNEARAISIHWNAVIEHWDELEALHAEVQSSAGWRKFRDRMDAILGVLCYKGCGELQWSDEMHARCPKCGDEVRRRDPRLPAPEKPKAVAAGESVRANLVAGYLLIDEDGEVVSGEENCPECEGIGTIECTCGNCNNCHDKTCSDCRGTGKQKIRWALEFEPTAEEGETVVVAILDKRNLKGPRIAFDDIATANRTLQILLQQPDSVLACMFTERRAA